KSGLRTQCSGGPTGPRRCGLDRRAAAHRAGPAAITVRPGPVPSPATISRSRGTLAGLHVVRIGALRGEDRQELANRLLASQPVGQRPVALARAAVAPAVSRA